MSSLEDDIARIAALRGRKPADYADSEQSKPKPSAEHVARAFQMGADGIAEQLAYDRLPPASRAFFRESPRPLNARIWAGMLANHAESDLIAKARSMIVWPNPHPSPRSRRAPSRAITTIRRAGR